MNYNGYIQLNLGGQKRGFKVGLYVIGELTKSLNIPIGDIEKAFTERPLESIANLLYHSAAYNCIRKGEDVDFTLLDVYEWIDEAGLESQEIQDFIKAVTDSFNKHVPEKKKKITRERGS